MHILVVNDDGPPGPASPYISPFVDILVQAGHEVSVVLPAHNSSGVGKSYDFGKTLQLRYYTPTNNSPQNAKKSWILVDGTPATCVQLGIHHLFPDRPPIDLVISGPNYGHNITAVYHLASGTLGGALEAALCNKKAISLSFAFSTHVVPGEESTALSPELINAACRTSLRLIEQLYNDWHDGVELYHINIPNMAPPYDPPRVVWTTAARSSVSSPSIYKLVNSQSSHPAPDDDGGKQGTLQPMKWAPRFSDVKATLEDPPPGTDAWALKQGFIGVIPMQAYYREVPSLTGEVDIDFSR